MNRPNDVFVAVWVLKIKNNTNPSDFDYKKQRDLLYALYTNIEKNILKYSKDAQQCVMVFIE